MKVEKNKPLKNLNTFGFEQFAEFYCEPANREDLLEAIEYANSAKLSIFLLGAGSNLVLANNISGLVIKLVTNSTQYVVQDSVTEVQVDAGVNWHSLVLDTVQREHFGLENLTLIPGNTGAAPIQNIGAYGTELKDVLVELTAISLRTREVITMSNADCQFGYRDSIFKNELAGELAIVRLTLALSTFRNTRSRYQALDEELRKHNLAEPSAREISDAVASIRRSKLPDPAVLGNAGSFFKNPTITDSKLTSLLQQSPNMPHYRVDKTHHKIPAAWLVEHAGWKGRRVGDIGVHNRQALVLVNYGQGTGRQLLEVAADIHSSVLDQFGIALVQEPVTL